jgi:O-methyltransferase
MLNRFKRIKQLAAAAIYRLKAPPYYYSSYEKKIDISKRGDLFSKLAGEVIRENRTLLGYDRLYTIYQGLAQLSNPVVAIEIGVYKGGGSKFIASVLKETGRSFKLYSCDTFTGHADVDQRYDGVHTSKSGFLDVEFKGVEAYLKSAPEITIIKGDICKTGRLITEPEIDFIHLDVDVYPPTLFVLNTFVPRLRKGGVVVIDDYGFTTCEGARIAVDEFIKANPQYFVFHLLTGQALILRK